MTEFNGGGALDPHGGGSAGLHERLVGMVLLGTEDLDTWIDPTAVPADLHALPWPCPDVWLDAYEVGAAVGNVKAQGEHLILPVG